MKQLREEFEPIRDGLARGESYLLLYRSRPLATLLPYEQSTDAQVVSIPQEPAIQQTSSEQGNTSPTTHQPSRQLQKFGLKKMLSP